VAQSRRTSYPCERTNPYRSEAFIGLLSEQGMIKIMATINSSVLPDIPQRPQLERIVQALVREENVRAVWVGGSVARATADRYSDVDLRVAVPPEALEQWSEPDFSRWFVQESDQVVGSLRLTFDGTFLHHLVLASGAIYDLLIQDTNRVFGNERNLLLFCRDEHLRQALEAANRTQIKPLFAPAKPDAIRELIETFWINSHKHRKVLARGLDLMAHTGIEAERKTLLRLYFIHATGRDTASKSLTIHTLTEIVREVDAAYGMRALELLGTSCQSRNAIVKTVETLRDEMAPIGQELAARYGFAYPHRLEQTVRQGWTEFLRTQ
jgi:hypothetical protein